MRIMLTKGNILKPWIVTENISYITLTILCIFANTIIFSKIF